MVVLTVLSGKGGVGKTTVTSNLAAVLSSEFNRKVIVLDSNISSAHVRLHFGLPDELKATLPDVIRGKSDVSEATYDDRITGVRIVPSSAGINKNVVLDKMKKLAQELGKSEYHFVIIDAAPGFGNDVINAIKAADKVLIVTTPSLPDISDALKAVELSRKEGKKIIVVVNRIKGKKYELNTKHIESMLETKIHMNIPDDEKVPESISYSVPVVAFSKGAKSSIAIKKLAASLIGKEYKPSIFDRIKWAFGF